VRVYCGKVCKSLLGIASGRTSRASDWRHREAATHAAAALPSRLQRVRR
jgi:hypothetical protein